MSKFKVGDRVRCVNQSRYAGREGTVESIRDYYGEKRQTIKWDGEPSNSMHGGSWTEGALERISSNTESHLQAQIDALTEKYAAALKVKNDALLIASTAFNQYADNHFAKETPEATIKALQNSALAELMNDALEAD